MGPSVFTHDSRGRLLLLCSPLRLRVWILTRTFTYRVKKKKNKTLNNDFYVRPWKQQLTWPFQSKVSSHFSDIIFIVNAWLSLHKNPQDSSLALSLSAKYSMMINYNHTVVVFLLLSLGIFELGSCTENPSQTNNNVTVKCKIGRASCRERV